MLFLYAVVPAGRLPPPAGATGDAPPVRLSVLSEGSVAVLYEERDAPPPAGRGALLTFAQVVEAVGAEGPALPVRFGTVLDDLDDLRGLLRERGDEWRERLAYVDGHTELVVHASDEKAPRPTPPAKGSGREYLLSRAATRRHTERVYDELAALLVPHCLEIRRLPGQDEVRLACLVAPAGTDKVRLALETWADAQEGRQATATGPWPPFTFAEERRA